MSVSGDGLRPARVVERLRLLDRRTGGRDGARRLAWTPTWKAARGLVVELAGPALEIEEDRAGNLWFTLRGESDELLVLGSHLDSVPAGGWLDGALGVLAGLEVVQGLLAKGPQPPRSVAVVDWADEEGARFGRSLFGSSAFAGSLDPSEVADLTDGEGNRAADVLASHGVDPDSLTDPDPRLAAVSAYLELHIEQGPILERAALPICAVRGTIGIERDLLIFEGQSAHAGPTPMEGRHDALLAAAGTALELEGLAIAADGRSTTGRIDLEPGVPTAVAGRATLYVDLRHPDPGELCRLRAAALAIATEAATRRGCSVRRERLWNIEPRDFDPELVERARAICGGLAPGADRSIVSGALHDAGELAPLVPTAMLFCASRRGLSHCVEEDSSPAAIEAGVRGLDQLARAVLGVSCV